MSDEAPVRVQIFKESFNHGINFVFFVIVECSVRFCFQNYRQKCCYGSYVFYEFVLNVCFFLTGNTVVFLL